MQGSMLLTHEFARIQARGLQKAEGKQSKVEGRECVQLPDEHLQRPVVRQAYCGSHEVLHRSLGRFGVTRQEALAAAIPPWSGLLDLAGSRMYAYLPASIASYCYSTYHAPPEPLNNTTDPAKFWVGV